MVFTASLIVKWGVLGDDVCKINDNSYESDMDSCIGG